MSAGYYRWWRCQGCGVRVHAKGKPTSRRSPNKSPGSYFCELSGRDAGPHEPNFKPDRGPSPGAMLAELNAKRAAASRKVRP